MSLNQKIDNLSKNEKIIELTKFSNDREKFCIN